MKGWNLSIMILISAVNIGKQWKLDTRTLKLNENKRKQFMYKNRKAVNIKHESTISFAEESLIIIHFREIFILLQRLQIFK
jgi:hypothetical protein